MPRFGSFELDAARRQLLRDGCEIHLTPKAFDLLCLLIDAAPRVVPKSELHQRLWPNGAVSDATLVGLVKEIRRALTDSRSTAPPIRTAHRVGYAFNVPLVREPTRRGVSCWLMAGKRLIPLAEGENVIGRDADANIPLDHTTVSRRHARLVVSDAGTVLEDLGSKNGTTVGGEPLAAAITLRNGDRFACGGVLLIYRESDLGMPTATQVSRVGAAQSRR